MGPIGAPVPIGPSSRQVQSFHVFPHHPVGAETRSELRHAQPHARHPGLRIALHVANWRVVTSAVAEKKAEIGVAELSDALLNENLQTGKSGTW